MIFTKSDLKRYLACDKAAMGIEKIHPSLIGDEMWKFEILYRKSEYHFNNRTNIFHRILYILYYSKYRLKCKGLCSDIPLNVFDEGLAIWHGQNIIVNGYAKVGKNFSMSAGCCIGQAHGKAPVIDDNVEMTIRSTIIGGIYVANDVTIGAGAVVVNDINEPFTTWGGVPAKCISHNINTYVDEKKKRLEILKSKNMFEV